METIITLIALVLLAVLAARFGADSRPGLRSKEHELAVHGMTWIDLAADLGPECAADAAAAWSRRPAASVRNSADTDAPPLALDTAGFEDAAADRLDHAA